MKVIITIRELIRIVLIVIRGFVLVFLLLW